MLNEKAVGVQVTEPETEYYYDPGATEHAVFLTGKGEPGVNLDKVNVAAGMRLAARFGYGDAESQLVIEYALMRHRRGEESGAERTALNGGIDLTSWKAALSAALAHAED